MRTDNKIAFVILHYQNIDVTLECMRNICALEEIDSCEIIIVDNASPNKSGIELQKRYDGISNVHVILNPKNGGFAYGNNIGYSEAIKKYGCKIAVVLNSDVFINDREFISKLRLYADKNKDIAILAPDIVVKNGYHQNPYLLNAISTSNQKKIILKKQIGYFLYGIPVIGRLLYNRKSVKNYEANRKEKVMERCKGIVPHGACVIYLSGWTDAETFAFVEGTFLFVEEELLYDYCTKKGYMTCYEPDFVVYHMEDASQDAINKDGIQKKRNQIKFEIQSRKLLLTKRELRKGTDNEDYV